MFWAAMMRLDESEDFSLVHIINGMSLGFED
jgi:hypothetical protein